jgi:para-aminobenzoate synthetase component 1
MIKARSNTILDTSSAAKQMNDLGRRKEPFLFLVDFLMRRPVVVPLVDLDPEEILYDINGITNSAGTSDRLPKIEFRRHPPDFARYSRAFAIVQENIMMGNSYLLNLTLPTRIETNLSLRQIFHFSRAKYRLCFRNELVVFSPETFVQIRDDRIRSFPMKGTIDAELKDAPALLLNDPKEKAEHTTVVDLIRNDLNMVAKNVRLVEFRRLDRIRTNQKDLLQMSSEIVGELPDAWEESLGDIMFRLLPAGSVSGAPKRKTVEIILEAEQYDRGYYTGICGLFDGESVDSCVMIRFIEDFNGELIFKSGGGITASSDLQREYQELVDKVYVPIV